MDRRIRMYIS